MTNQKTLKKRAKLFKAHVASLEEIMVMSVFKIGFKVLPTGMADKLATLPAVVMGLDSPREQELKERYFTQTAEQSRKFVATMELVKYMSKNRIRDALKSAALGQEAPNTTVFNLNAEPVGILELQRKQLIASSSKARPLMLHFGSCS